MDMTKEKKKKFRIRFKPHWLGCSWSRWSDPEEGKGVYTKRTDPSIRIEHKAWIQSRSCAVCNKHQLREAN